MSVRRSSRKGVDASSSRARREANAISIRKEKRDENLMKRRSAAPVEAWGESKGGEEEKDGSNTAVQRYTVSDFPQMVQQMRTGSFEEKVVALKSFRKLLSAESNPPVEECVKCGALPIFVQFLQAEGQQELQFESAWALTNIASTDRTRLVVEHGAVPHLVKLLLNIDAETRDQSAWCLGNIAGDSPALRDEVLNHPGAMEGLLQNLAQPANVGLMRNCTWTLSNFCRGKPQPPLAKLLPALPALAHLVGKSNDGETMTDAAWALSYISDGDNDRINAVVDHNIVPLLINMMSSEVDTQITPALRSMGNIVSGNDHCTQAAVDAGFLSACATLLSHPKKAIRKETCWGLSNIAAGSPDQLLSLMNTPGIVPGVIEALSNSSEWDVRKEAAWVVSNIATSNQPGHLAILVEHNFVAPLCELLDVNDGKIVMVGLEALEALLRADTAAHSTAYAELVQECGGVEAVENLQEHANDDIYQKAVHLIEEFFNGEEEDDQNMAPAVNAVNGQFAFGLPTVPTGKAASDFGDSFMQNAGAAVAPTYAFGEI